MSWRDIGSQWRATLIDFELDLVSYQARTQNTADLYLSDLKKMAEYFTCLEKEPEDVTREDVDIYVAKLTTEKGYKTATIARHLVSIRKFFDWGEDNLLNGSNPAFHLRPVKVEKKKPDYLSTQEVESLTAFLQSKLSAPGGKRDLALFLILLDTGRRITEILERNIGDVVLEEDPPGIYIPNLWEDTQKVELNTKTADAIRVYLDSRAYYRQDPLYVEIREGKRLTRQGAWLLLKEISKKAGTRPITPNLLRNTAIKRRIDEGIHRSHIAATVGGTLASLCNRFPELTSNRS